MQKIIYIESKTKRLVGKKVLFERMCKHGNERYSILDET